MSCLHTVSRGMIQPDFYIKKDKIQFKLWGLFNPINGWIFADLGILVIILISSCFFSRKKKLLTFLIDI